VLTSPPAQPRDESACLGELLFIKRRTWHITAIQLSEFYAIPKEGIGVRGGDIDKNGVLWGSGTPAPSARARRCW
jgi:hypothetical protein